MANNQIEEEEGLLTLQTWPYLEEVVIWGNPVAISGKEGPPVVMYQLGLVSGIKVASYINYVPWEAVPWSQFFSID